MTNPSLRRLKFSLLDFGSIAQFPQYFDIVSHLHGFKFTSAPQHLLISSLLMLFLNDRTMRLTFSLPCLLVVLTVISVVVALPALDSVTSSVSSLVPRRPQDESQHADPHAHLLARRSEIYELEKRQQVNCTNRYALFFTECWDILNIHDYLVAPGTGWINTVRHCQNTGGNTWDNDGSNCCVDGEPWSTCYLRLAIPGSNHDCTSASTGRCGDSMIDDINVAPAIYPYVRYTVKNIYGRDAQSPY